MEGYVIASYESKNIKGGVFDVTTFQGEHCDEYLVKDSESGERRLYRKGVLELNWREEYKNRLVNSQCIIRERL